MFYELVLRNDRSYSFSTITNPIFVWVAICSLSWCHLDVCSNPVPTFNQRRTYKNSYWTKRVDSGDKAYARTTKPDCTNLVDRETIAKAIKYQIKIKTYLFIKQVLIIIILTVLNDPFFWKCIEWHFLLNFTIYWKLC